MDFDRIFPLIIIMVIWGIGAVMRNLPRKDQEDSAPVNKPPGFFKVLQQGLAALEEKSRVDGPLELDGHLQPVAVVEPAKPVQRKLSLIDRAERAAAPESIDISEKVDSRSTPPDPVSREPKPGPVARIDRRKLRNAVVWAEILAPPVALRD